MKYVSIISAAMMALSVPAIADEQVDKSIAALKMNEKLANFDVSHDKEMTDKLKAISSFNDEIVKVAGNRMGLNVDSGIVYQLSAAFSLNDLSPIQGLVSEIVMANPANLDWYAVSMDESIEVKATAYVFTDPTCGYCVKMHKEHAQLEAEGIKTVLIPWPRQGLNEGSQGYDQWVSVACAVNPGDAYIDLLENGTAPVADPSKTIDECKQSVAKGFNLGREIGVSGTPYIYAKNNKGEIFTTPGYLPASKLAEKIK